MKRTRRVLWLLWAALLLSGPRAWAYPCFYELSAPTRQGGGQTLLSGHVDAASGAFTWLFTCMTVPGAIPLDGSIYTSTQDNSSGPFGTGTSSAYDWFIKTSVAWPGSPYVLIAPGNRHYVFDVAPVGGNYVDTRDPRLLGAALSFTSQPPGVWCTLTFKNGLKEQFDPSGGLIAVVDRLGNTVTVLRNQINGFAAMVYLGSNTNRMIQFLQDPGSHRVTKIRAQYSYTGSVRTWTLGYSVDWAKLTNLYDPFGLTVDHMYTLAYTSYTRSDGVVLPLLQTVTDPRPMTCLSAHYDGSGRVSSLDAPLGGAHTFTYSAPIGTDGTVTGVDPDGESTTVTFAWQPYKHGYTVSQIKDNTLNETTTIAHGAPPTTLPTAVTDFRARVTAYTWDTATGDLKTVAQPTATGGTITHQFFYDPLYHVRNKVIDPLGRTYLFAVDGSGRVSSATNPAGEVTSFTYDGTGQIATVTDPLFHTSTWGRDAYGQVTSFTDAAGHATSLVRNDIGLIWSLTDPTGMTISYLYDLMDRMTSVTEMLSGSPLVTSYVYDSVGNQTKATDALGHVWSWQYDCVGNIIKETDPLARSRTWAFSPTNNLLVYTDFAGNKIEGSYLVDGRLSAAVFRKADASVESSISYSYDPTSHLLASISDSAAGATTYGRDLLNRLVSFTTPNGSLTYQYDALGRMTQMQVAGQPAVTYAYNPRGNLSQTTQSGQTISFSYDPLGRLTGQTFPNGVVTEKEFDSAGLIDMVCSAKGGLVFDQTSYSRDAAGKVTAVNDNGNIQSITYDSVGRPTGLTAPGTTYAWAYDSVGKKIQETVNAVPTALVYDSANQLTSYAGLPITRNVNGYPTAANGRTYTWNGRGQLTGYTAPGTTLSMVYDTQGRLMRQTTAGVTTNFTFSGGRPVLANTGGVITAYWNGPTMGGPLKGGASFFSTNGNGSTTKLTDATGTMVASYTYGPFGGLVGSTGSVVNPIQFKSGNTLHSTLIRTAGVSYSPEWEQPLGGVGILPYHPTLPSSTVSHPITSTGSWFLGDAETPTNHADNPSMSPDETPEERYRRSESGCDRAYDCEGFTGPPGSGTSTSIALEAQAGGAVPGMTIGLGVSHLEPQYCKPGAVAVGDFAAQTGSEREPWGNRGLESATGDVITRSACAIGVAERINFNLDGFSLSRAMEPGFTNIEFATCMHPKILPKVTFWECLKVVPAPANPYAPSYEGAADPTGAIGPSPGEMAGR